MMIGCTYALQISVDYMPPDTRDMLMDWEDDGHLKESYFFMSTEVTIPEDLKLVTAKGDIVDDKLCVGDKFTFEKAVDKGEYWDEGGYIGSPPIYWVEDITSAAKSLMSCGNAETRFSGPVYTAKEGMRSLCYDLSMMIDPDIFPYKEAIQGGLACSLSEGSVDAGDAVKSGGYYEVVNANTINFNAEFDVGCMYYYLSKQKNYQELAPAMPWAMAECDGTEAQQFNPNINPFGESFGEKFACESLNAGAFKIGSIGLSKTITIVERGEPEIEISVPAGDKAVLGESIALKVIVKNKGNVAAVVKDVGSKAPSELISCDKASINPGDQTECLLWVTPQPDTGLDIKVTYGYESCAESKTGQITKEVIMSTMLGPSNAAQVYGIDVHGGCENSYYACDTTAKDGLYTAGYRCLEKEGYYTPASGRFNVLFDLSGISDCSVVSSARLVLTAVKVNKAQDVEVYDINDDWSQVSCSPGGDICTQPYCSECKPLYDASPNLLSSVKVSSLGDYYVDVTAAVKSACNSDRRLSLQIRGDEDVWDISGVSSCGLNDQWKEYGVSFQSTGTRIPHLQILTQ
ncbi:MAG: hypothetical protein JW724_01730 [Candidatus Altiarchaeota archaeon]|nr:hypothetical protein [Candidatus Altiarchaeota archaeon]